MDYKKKKKCGCYYEVTDCMSVKAPAQWTIIRIAVKNVSGN